MSYQLDTHLPSRQFHLNSKHARNIGVSQYVWDLSETLSLDAKYNFLVSVVSAQIPFSMYTINDSNKVFLVNGVEYSIPVGNYNVLELIREVANAVGILTLEYNQITNKVRVASDTAFSIRNSGSHEPFLRLLGFKLDLYEDQTEYVSDSVVNLSGISSIHLISNLGTQNFDSFSKKGSHVLARLPVNTVSNGIIFWENLFHHRSLISQTTISEIAIELLDSQFFPVDLNGVDFSITLQLDVIKKPSVKQVLNITKPPIKKISKPKV